MDPLTQDIYFMPLMGTEWHLWRAGNQQSVCGLSWTVAARCWDAATEKPASAVCTKCSELGEEGKRG